MIEVIPDSALPAVQAFASGVALLVIASGALQNLVYLVQMTVAGWAVLRTPPIENSQLLWWHNSEVSMPISLLAPAYNEEATIVESVRALLSLQYPTHEVLVINDGSRDGTLAKLIETFELRPASRAFDLAVDHAPIRGLYSSKRHPRLLVIDKENGGKADALNAGINISRYPLVCAIDADSILEADSLLRATQPFVQGSDQVVAVGGTIRVVNGCRVRAGRIVEVGVPTTLLPLFQTVEYLRAFLMARIAWSELGLLTLISGAFGIFRRNVLIDIGGYSHGTVGEDLELIIKMHRHFREQGRPYEIRYVPEPVCWTEVPARLPDLSRQRIRWHRGALETFFKHRDMLFNARYGRVGWVGFGNMLLTDVIAPPIEVLGYLLIPLLWALGWISWDYVLAFGALSVIFGIVLSVGALILEEAGLRRFPRARQLLLLTAAAVLENFGYRQYNNVMRMVGHWRFLRRTTGGWGAMTRSGFRTR